MNVASATATPTPLEKPTSIFSKVTSLSFYLYPAALVAAVSIWFLAIRAPLWLDETLAYWQVAGGFGKVWSRSAMMPSSIGYLYTLWLAKTVLGSSEIALKIPSTVAMMGAVYFLYRAAKQLYDRETAYLACIFFALTQNVIFAATDARPYAFALLASNVAIFAFVRWMDKGEMRQAVLFGAAAAGVLYFHYLFGAILPVFAIYYLVARGRLIKEDWRQLAAVIGIFCVVSLPLMYRVASLYSTRESHVVQAQHHPILVTLNIFAPLQVLIGFVAVAFLAALVRKIKLPGGESFPAILFGPLLAIVPVAVFFGVGAVAPVHLVIPRYLTVIASGSALTWALLTKQLDSPFLRKFFCVGLVALTVYESYSSPLSRLHEINFKRTHALVNANLAANGDRDKVAVLEASAFIESDFRPMPTERGAEDPLLSQIEYYPIDAPVIMMPMDLDEQAMRIGRKTVLDAAQRRQRFLVIAPPTSAPTVQWFMDYTEGAFTARVLGEFEQIGVVEFRPN